MGDKISGYRGGYTPLERKEIERKMISGELSGLISTNALELGIDIGKIDTTILVGYPGTRASFWQQTGRAGRNQKRCSNYMILDNLPFDQYIAVNPDWLFEGGSETAVIDKNNLLIELAHIRAAAAEIPLTLDDIAVFPDLGETIPVLIKAKELNGQNGRFAWSGSSFPAGDFSLRNIDKARYKLINQENDREITEMDEMQAFREIHRGAVYMHGGNQYQVLKLDLESKTAYAVPFKGNYYTMPGGITDIRVIKEQKSLDYKRIKASFGDVNVNDMIHMFKKLQFHNHQNLGYEQLERPLAKAFETESSWIRIPDNVARVYRSLIQEGPNGQAVRNNHFEGLCYAIKNAAMMATMTEQEDIGTTMSLDVLDLSVSGGFEAKMFIYDKYIGGLGYAEKIFDLLPQILKNAVQMVDGCRCEKGCAACIGDFRLDKSLVLWGLKNLLEESEAPRNIKTAEFAPSTFIKKPFQFKELKEKWEEFCSYLQENGENFAAFLSTVHEVETDGDTLVLVMDNPFYKEWISEETNRKSLLNIVGFYTDAPRNLRLEIRVNEGRTDRNDVRDKLEKRYENLTE